MPQLCAYVPSMRVYSALRIFDPLFAVGASVAVLVESITALHAHGKFPTELVNELKRTLAEYKIEAAAYSGPTDDLEKCWQVLEQRPHVPACWVVAARAGRLPFARRLRPRSAAFPC